MTATACCFCDRTVDQVRHLIQGPELAICDICVDACIDTLATKDVGWRERQIDYLLRLRNRKTLAAGN
jgi:ATP-dependent protease Clp ATPase subunit